jgi:CO/xanthine dehydrogenase Mo-binding subunit
VPAGQVEVKGGAIYVQGEGQPRASLKEMGEEIGDFTILGKGSRGPNKDGFEVNTFGAQFADVEVDVATGETKVIKVVSVHDCGRVINTLGGSNQVEGAVVQGIGYALTEQRVVDSRTGIVLNANLEDYKVATAMDIFDIDHAFINKPDEVANSLGAKGLGEPALIPTAPAIANAIARAIGIRFNSIPITRYKIIEALNSGKA